MAEPLGDKDPIPSPPPAKVIAATAAGSGLTVNLRDRIVSAYYITEPELDAFQSGYSSPNGVLLGVAAGLLVGALGALTTSSLDSSGRLLAGSVAIGSTFGALITGTGFVRDQLRARALVKQIRERRSPTS